MHGTDYFVTLRDGRVIKVAESGDMIAGNYHARFFTETETISHSGCLCFELDTRGLKNERKNKRID